MVQIGSEGTGIESRSGIKNSIEIPATTIQALLANVRSSQNHSSDGSGLSDSSHPRRMDRTSIVRTIRGTAIIGRGFPDYFLANDERMQHYQRGRASITGLGLW